MSQTRNPAMKALKSKMTGTGFRASWGESTGAILAWLKISGPLSSQYIGILDQCGHVFLIKARIVAADRSVLIHQRKLDTVLNFSKHVPDMEGLESKQVYGPRISGNESPLFIGCAEPLGERI